jgi:hypothetical protein
MVFYFKDLNVPDKILDALIIIIVLLIFSLPFLIYKKSKYALRIALFLALIQAIAIVMNIQNNPL